MMHPADSLYLIRLSCQAASLGRVDEALEIQKQLAIIDDAAIPQVLSFSSDDQSVEFLEAIRYHTEIYLSLLVEYFADSPREVANFLELLFRRKSLTLEAQRIRSETARDKPEPETKQLFDELTDFRRRLSRIERARVHRNSGDAGVENKLKSKIAELEIALSQLCSQLDLEIMKSQITCETLAGSLPPESAFLEVYRCHRYQATRTGFELKPEIAHYFVFVLTRETYQSIKIIDLGMAALVDALCSRFVGGLTGESRRSRFFVGGGFPRGLLSIDVDPPEGANQFNWNLESGIKLREAIFDPVLPELKDRKVLIVCPDGELWHIPLGVLPRSECGHLLEDYLITYVTSARDVISKEVSTSLDSSLPLVIADPDFDLRLDLDGSVKNESLASTPTMDHEILDVAESPIKQKQHFPRLPGTRTEGVEIAKILRVTAWLDDSVLAHRLKSVRSPIILHIATHGYYIDEAIPDSPFSKFESIGSCGLALSGANTFFNNGNLPDEAEDGLLTAEDISGMNLVGTKLVVLSACNTGIGDLTQISEGIFGLRRAFRIAGAKTIVASLWKVSDNSTQELMQQFYLLLVSGKSISESLRQAQLKMRNRYNNPFDWGAFICHGIGDDRLF